MNIAGRQQFRGFVRVGADLPAHRSSEQLPASAHRSSCRAATRGAATHRPDQAALTRAGTWCKRQMRVSRLGAALSPERSIAIIGFA
jgi:hypothetical protein